MSRFRYLLALENRDPVDPAVFVTAVSDWNVGQTFVVSNGQAVPQAQQRKLPVALPRLPLIPLRTNVPPLALPLNETPRPPHRFPL